MFADGLRQRLQRFNVPGLKNTQGCGNPGLELVNAFGVRRGCGNPGLESVHSCGVRRACDNPGLELVNAFGVR